MYVLKKCHFQYVFRAVIQNYTIGIYGNILQSTDSSHHNACIKNTPHSSRHNALTKCSDSSCHSALIMMNRMVSSQCSHQKYTDFSYQNALTNNTLILKVSKISFLHNFVNSTHTDMYDTSKESCAQGLCFFFHTSNSYKSFKQFMWRNL